MRHSDIANGKTGGRTLRSIINPGGTSLKSVWDLGFISTHPRRAHHWNPGYGFQANSSLNGNGLPETIMIDALRLEPPATQPSQRTSQVPEYSCDWVSNIPITSTGCPYKNPSTTHFPPQQNPNRLAGHGVSTRITRDLCGSSCLCHPSKA